MLKNLNRFWGIVMAAAFILTSCISSFAYTDSIAV